MSRRNWLLKMMALMLTWQCGAFTFGQSAWNSFQNGGDLENQELEIPTDWSPESVAWKLKLTGYGQSSPIVWNDAAFVTSVTGANKETLNVQSISLADGKQNWLFQLPNSSPEKNTPMVSRAAPTPIADQDGVIAFFEGGNLIALDHQGGVRWKRDLRKDYGEIKARHGLAGSLEQDDAKVYVWCERMDSPYVVAISKSDGETVWKSPGIGGTSWASPRLIQVASQRHLVLSGSGVIAGLDPATGKKLWDFRDVQGNTSTTPIPVSPGKFLIGSSGGRDDSSTGNCGVVEVLPTDQGYLARWKWAAKDATSSFGSPCAIGGRVYFVTRSGVLHCHDQNSGDKLFAGRLPAGQIWATPMATKQGIYFFGKSGVTTIVSPGPKLKVVAKNVLWESGPAAGQAGQTRERDGAGVLYAAAASGNTLLLRRGDMLYSVKNGQ